MKYSQSYDSRQFGRWLFISIAVFLAVIILATVAYARYWYNDQLKPLSSTPNSATVIVPEGSTAQQISELLAEKGIIKNAKAFEWYLRLNKLRSSMQAGQYVLDSSQSSSAIAQLIAKGKVKTSTFTILPGQRLDQIKAAFINAGFSEMEVNKALLSSTHKNHPALVSKPANATLEGYLYPETFQTTNTTTPTQIVTQSLDQTAKLITSDLVDKVRSKGLSVHQAIILASIVEKEVSNVADRRMVAQVFLNRLKIGMSLGSDVTYKYAAIITGQEATAFIDSPYNTRKYAGLPPGPISNVSTSSLNAVANPSPNDYLFFVSGDDGKNYYSKTQAEHEALAEQHCKVLCSTY